MYAPERYEQAKLALEGVQQEQAYAPEPRALYNAAYAVATRYTTRLYYDRKLSGGDTHGVARSNGWLGYHEIALRPFETATPTDDELVLGASVIIHEVAHLLLHQGALGGKYSYPRRFNTTNNLDETEAETAAFGVMSAFTRNGELLEKACDYIAGWYPRRFTRPLRWAAVKAVVELLTGELVDALSRKQPDAVMRYATPRAQDKAEQAGLAELSQAVAALLFPSAA